MVRACSEARLGRSEKANHCQRGLGEAPSRHGPGLWAIVGAALAWALAGPGRGQGHCQWRVGVVPRCTREGRLLGHNDDPKNVLRAPHRAARYGTGAGAKPPG